MSLPKAFIEAVNKKEVLSIRIMMKNSLLVDPTFKEFNEMNAAASNIPDVYVSHDGKDFILDKSQWDEQYISRIMAQVIGNFSHERVDHLKDVVRYLRPAPPAISNKKVNKTSAETSGRHPKSEYQRQKERDQANGNFRPRKIAMGAGIGAAAGAAIMAAVSGPIILGAVGGAAVGAGVVAVVTKGER